MFTHSKSATNFWVLAEQIRSLLYWLAENCRATMKFASATYCQVAEMNRYFTENRSKPVYWSRCLLKLLVIEGCYWRLLYSCYWRLKAFKWFLIIYLFLFEVKSVAVSWGMQGRRENTLFLPEFFPMSIQ